MWRPISIFTHSWIRSVILPGAALLLVISVNQIVPAQENDLFGDGSADPLKLFERGQNAHARGDLLRAIEFYAEAIKVRPEFAEAEFQRGNALVALTLRNTGGQDERFAEAESGFRRAIELRKDWPLPQAALGALLVRLNRDKEAELVLRNTLKLDRQNNLALRMLADVRLRAGDAREALELTQHATKDKETPISTWVLRALAERATGNKVGALASLDHVLEIEPENVSALTERAEILIEKEDYERAAADLKAAEQTKIADKSVLSRIAEAYDRAGKKEDAARVALAAGLVKSETAPVGAKKVWGTTEEINEANSEDPEVSRKALEKLLQKNPGNAMLLARLGASYRTVDPARSLDYYRRATEIQPGDTDYAAGYGSALVQAKRFQDAVMVLRKVVSASPDNHAAHANLATAFYQLKLFPQALEQYKWLLEAEPDLTVAYFFIATAHDYLGEYEQALPAYEAFLARADAKTNQLEIEKVKLRLPSLRRQIKLGQGVKRKT